MCKWIILKLSQTYRPSFKYFEMTSQFLRLGTCCDVETFQNMSAWQKKLINDVIFHFLTTSVKRGSWSINYTPVMWSSQWHQLSPLPRVLYAYYSRKKVYTPSVKDIDDFEITISKEYWLFIKFSKFTFSKFSSSTCSKAYFAWQK